MRCAHFKESDAPPMNAPAWQPRTVLRFVKALPTSTNVVRVDTDEGEGFLKALGNPEGPHVLACELVGTILAEWLGLPTFQHAIVWITPDDEIPLAGGGMAAPGPAFITKAESGFPWGGDAETLWRVRNREDVSRLVILDTWIRNCDRFRPEPNRRVNRDNVFLAWDTTSEPAAVVLKAIDHSHAFTCGRELTRRIGHLEEIRETTLFGCFPEFRSLLDRESARAACLRLANMDKARAAGIMARVPDDWHVEASVRESWASFIVGRAAFVAANIESWLWP
jgi:hypothetical protein